VLTVYCSLSMSVIKMSLISSWMVTAYLTQLQLQIAGYRDGLDRFQNHYLERFTNHYLITLLCLYTYNIALLIITACPINS